MVSFFGNHFKRLGVKYQGLIIGWVSFMVFMLLRLYLSDFYIYLVKSKPKFFTNLLFRDTYLIFVIFFTQARFWENKFTPKIA